MQKIVVLSGAGISAESGLKTFRDSDGLWEGHDVMTVASIQGWDINPELVLDFYNQRRKQLLEVKPNKAHLLLAQLEQSYQVNIITQNVDDLHERAGSTNVLHLHGELLKAQSSKYKNLVYKWTKDIAIGDKCERGYQLRPFIVWFGEEVPLLSDAAQLVSTADKVIIVGTSMQVYPAASLVAYAPQNCEIYYIDRNPSVNYELKQIPKLNIIQDTASNGIKELLAQWS